MALPLQKSPEVPQSGTHHHRRPRPGPAPLPTTRYSHHCDRFFFLIGVGSRHIDSISPFHGAVGSHAGQQ